MNVVEDLFESEDTPIVIEDDSLSVKFWRNFVPAEQRAAIFRTLLAETPWRETELHIYGRRVKMPRMTCWFGDAGAVYTYSGVRNDPLPWTPKLTAMLADVQRATGATFNSVLLNLYRNGKDYMSWHRDDEKELGPSPVIASVSLGASRRFDFRRKRADERATRPTKSFELADGSLLVMSGDTQRKWQHSIPKSGRADEPRINLTFRRIY